jgi:tRNA(adenine34) deaminase
MGFAHARLRRVYFAAHDEKAGAVESGVRFFDNPACHHRPEIYGGIGAAKARTMLQEFFAERR